MKFKTINPSVKSRILSETHLFPNKTINTKIIHRSRSRHRSQIPSEIEKQAADRREHGKQRPLPPRVQFSFPHTHINVLLCYYFFFFASRTPLKRGQPAPPRATARAHYTQRGVNEREREREV